jgi:hypothetical protein
MFHSEFFLLQMGTWRDKKPPDTTTSTLKKAHNRHMEQRPSDETVLVVESLVIITQWQQVCYELLTDVKDGYIASRPFSVLTLVHNVGIFWSKGIFSSHSYMQVK